MNVPVKTRDAVMPLRLPRRVSPESIEQIARSVGDAALELELQDWRKEEATAEARITGLVARVRRRADSSLVLRIHNGEEVPGLRSDSRYWHELTEKLVGISLLLHATSVRDEFDQDLTDELTRRLREVLQRSGGALTPGPDLQSSGSRFAVLAIDGPNATPLAPIFGNLSPDNKVTFRRELHDLITRHCHVPKLNSFALVADYVREALENAEQHGTTPFPSTPRDTLRFLHVRNYRANPQSMGKGDPAGVYLNQFRRHFGKNTNIVELSVVDDGIGIAAQMAGGDLSIYTRNVAEETEHVLHALTREGTSKKDRDAGAGLDTVLKACEELKGFFSLRTGRCTVHRDYLNDSASQVAHVEVQSTSAMLGGTSMSMLVPWTDPELF